MLKKNFRKLKVNAEKARKRVKLYITKDIDAADALDQTENRIREFNKKFNNLKNREIRNFRHVILNGLVEAIHNGEKKIEKEIDFSDRMKNFWIMDVAGYLGTAPDFFTNSMKEFIKELKNYYLKSGYKISIDFSSDIESQMIDSIRIMKPIRIKLEWDDLGEGKKDILEIGTT